MVGTSLIWTSVLLAGAASLGSQGLMVASLAPAALSEHPSGDACFVADESFSLDRGDLPVVRAEGGILFTAGMTIDADGAPNAYGPQNRGLDYTANARGAHGWAALVTSEDGRPVIQKRGKFRGYYVSTTSLQQSDVNDQRDPKRYIDATRIPYIVLPQDFARTFDIHLGDLVVVVNQANGRAVYAIYADVGPRGRIGEGSIALAKALGMPADPRHDSVADGVTYLIFPGSALPAARRITPRNFQPAASRLLHRWGGRVRLLACGRPLPSN